jgi:hypothetical protein
MSLPPRASLGVLFIAAFTAVLLLAVGAIFWLRCSVGTHDPRRSSVTESSV